METENKKTSRLDTVNFWIFSIVLFIAMVGGCLYFEDVLSKLLKGFTKETPQSEKFYFCLAKNKREFTDAGKPVTTLMANMQGEEACSRDFTIYEIEVKRVK